MKSRRNLPVSLLILLAAAAALPLATSNPLGSLLDRDRFRQLDELLPTPNAYRTASGAPGHAYWQQKVDYEIDVTLDDDRRWIHGSERILYHNQSPDTLRYLWIQLDPNIFFPESHAATSRTAGELSRLSYDRLRAMLHRQEFDGRCRIDAVESAAGTPLDHTIVDTMMRVDLKEPLPAGGHYSFRIDWNYPINDHDLVGGRTGYEVFEKDGNSIYEMAQWFPRLCVYSDSTGWQNKVFIGSGEFALQFGDYTVRITAPDDHVVAATGVLQNPDEVLESSWRERLLQAETAAEPVFIVTPEEAEANETSQPQGTRTWIFRAENVRDFAWASSRKFIWDAKLHTVPGGTPTWCMSYYPKEGEPLWSRYSTHAIIHTLDVYSDHTFPYPYPTAISVNGPVGGMEYPMICFNGPRPEKDGTYSERTKYGLISVIIHEVGHNYFPMVVNSDERQWTWMDEGLNTFLQFLAEQRWEEDYPSRRGEPSRIVSFMKSDRQMPIMTNSESLLQFGSNAYAKPATALNILRETVMGRELFDFAFQEYSRRWMFKHPEPADFFRTMEDASGVDLDWFFRGWFYTTDHVDLAIKGIRLHTIDSRDPEVEKKRRQADRKAEPLTQTKRRNQGMARYLDRYPTLADFYNSYDDLEVTEADVKAYDKLVKGLSEEDRELLELELRFYLIELENQGGLPMPVVLEVTYEDGSVEEVRSPAEVWRKNGSTISRLLLSEKKIASLVLDPHLETADVDLSDNFFPPRIDEESLQLDKSSGRRRGGAGKNPMQKARDANKKKEEEEKGEGGAQADPDAQPDQASRAGKRGRRNAADGASGTPAKQPDGSGRGDKDDA